MRYDWETDKGFVLSSGRRLHSTSDILGVGLNGDGLFYGGDGRVHEEDEEGDSLPFTPAERDEIAGAMIVAWGRWLRQEHKG